MSFLVLNSRDVFSCSHSRGVEQYAANHPHQLVDVLTGGVIEPIIALTSGALSSAFNGAVNGPIRTSLFIMVL